jgi:hypothetical protein
VHETRRERGTGAACVLLGVTQRPTQLVSLVYTGEVNWAGSEKKILVY